MIQNDLVVHFYITPECKMNCPFCYAFEHRSPEKPLTTGEVEDLIKKCRSLGARSMVFCGGDPFSRRDIAKIIEIAKSYNLTTRIDSNLLSYSEDVMDNISQYIDWLALPLDGPNAKSHDKHRNWPGHFKIIMRMVNSLHTKYPHVNLKIHTLVTKGNYDNISEMPSLIREIAPTVWSIYTYFRAGVGRNNFHRFELSESQISEIKSIRNTTSKIPVDVVSSESHGNAYIFITADGRVYRQPDSQGGDYVVIGDYRQGALEKALMMLDREGNYRRASVYHYSNDK